MGASVSRGVVPGIVLMMSHSFPPLNMACRRGRGYVMEVEHVMRGGAKVQAGHRTRGDGAGALMECVVRERAGPGVRRRGLWSVHESVCARERLGRIERWGLHPDDGGPDRAGRH